MCSSTYDDKSATRCRGHQSSRVETSVVMKYSVNDDIEGDRRYIPLSASDLHVKTVTLLNVKLELTLEVASDVDNLTNTRHNNRYSENNMST